MIGRPVASSVEAYAAGVRGWACAIPDMTVHVISDSSGPNERKMETLPALAVQQLSIAEAYRIGRTVRFIGFVLDKENQRVKIGERVHRLLHEYSRTRHAGGVQYTAEELTDDFVDAFANRLSKDAPWLHDRILAYADTTVTFRHSDDDPSELGPLEAETQRRAMAGYSHPKLEELEQQVLPVVPAFHVSGVLYGDLERSSWTTIDRGVAKIALGFAIIVDGEHFVPLIGDADTLARTEYLLVDARAPLWIVSERVRMRDRASSKEAVQTTGFEWNSQTYERTMLTADASYEITGRVVSRRDLTQKEQDRMLHVTLGFMAMLSHTKIAIEKLTSPPDRGDRFRVELVGSYTVDQIVDDINHRRHIR